MEEKIKKLYELLQELKGKKVYLIDKAAPDAELEGKFAIIGDVKGERCTYWIASGGKFVNMYDEEEYTEPYLISTDAYIGNIAAITLSSADIYRRDIPENIIFEDEEMFNESKSKAR